MYSNWFNQSCLDVIAESAARELSSALGTANSNFGSFVAFR